MTAQPQEPKRAGAASVPPRPASIYPILAVTLVGAMGFSVVLPFLVFLVTRWGGNGFVFGLMGATYSAFQLVGAPGDERVEIGGTAMDRP